MSGQPDYRIARQPVPGHDPRRGRFEAMHRPSRFEHTRFLGDKRTQLVYDVDSWQDAEVIDEIVAAETGICFGPDTLAEARNRGYRAAIPGRRSPRQRRPRA
jgi:hypothetical protein